MAALAGALAAAAVGVLAWPRVMTWEVLHHPVSPSGAAAGQLVYDELRLNGQLRLRLRPRRRARRSR